MKIVKRSIAISRVEQALLIDSPKMTDKAKAGDFKRLYFGQEFCERLLPSISQLKAVKLKAEKSGKKFTLLTPPVTEAGINKMRLLLKCLSKEDEVVANDYGMLYMLSLEFVNPVIIGRLIGRNTLLVLNGMAKDSGLVRQYVGLLGERVFMLEVDSFNSQDINPLLQGLIRFSFRSEPFFWTVTRRCAFNRRNNGLNKFGPCNKECLRQKAVIRNKAAGKLFLLKGNGIIDLSPVPDEPAASINLQRIVKVYR